MKVIIAGGRDYRLTRKDILKLSAIDITEVVSGGCSGADWGGERYAKINNLPVKMFRADWKLHSRAAGPIRNVDMAEYADAVVLFPGGKGTTSMFNQAGKAGIKIYDYRVRGVL